jgi:tRNA G10  N-methylase Trm11
MDFLIKFAQAHETFRLPEIKALAIVEGVDMEIIKYHEDVRYTNSVNRRLTHIHSHRSASFDFHPSTLLCDLFADQSWRNQFTSSGEREILSMKCESQ